MAARIVVLMPVLLALAFCLVIEATSDCGNGSGCFYSEAAPPEFLSRKLLISSKDVLFKGFKPISPRGGNTISWEMRVVPSGPDPLHHNRSPKKPQTP